MASLDKNIHETEISSVTVMRSSAAERNKNAILEVLKEIVPSGSGQALEISSGTGQHVAHFAELLPNVTWQPSECDKKSMQSIMGYIQVTQRSNLKEPVWIDTTDPADQWANGNVTAGSFDLILCINMVHIAEWPATEGLFQGSGHFLKENGILALYGPFKMHGEITPQSNVQFDQMLKQQNTAWGLRDTDDLEKLAQSSGLKLDKMVDMPANNKTLVFRKAAS